MKYFIQYPLYEVCNLHCAYCLHGKRADIKDKEHPETEYCWSLEQYKTWRDRNLGSDEIILHLATGEPCFGKNIETMKRLFVELDREKFDILTNGTMPIPEYWETYSDRIVSIGATYHRKTMTPPQAESYDKNIRLMKSLGLPVYVKELLVEDDLELILQNRDRWENEGVPVKIQHFRETGKDDALDVNLAQYIDGMYRSYDFEIDECKCRAGYTGIILRMDGRVLVCWHDQRIVGNIQDGTYMPGAKVIKQVNADGIAKCHVYMPGEAIDRAKGKTLGEIRRELQKREMSMNRANNRADDGSVDVSAESYLFAASQRFQDGIKHLTSIVNEMSNVILQQNRKIADLTQNKETTAAQ